MAGKCWLWRDEGKHGPVLPDCQRIHHHPHAGLCPQSQWKSGTLSSNRLALLFWRLDLSAAKTWQTFWSRTLPTFVLVSGTQADIQDNHYDFNFNYLIHFKLKLFFRWPVLCFGWLCLCLWQWQHLHRLFALSHPWPRSQRFCLFLLPGPKIAMNFIVSPLATNFSTKVQHRSVLWCTFENE